MKKKNPTTNGANVAKDTNKAVASVQPAAGLYSTTFKEVRHVFAKGAPTIAITHARPSSSCLLRLDFEKDSKLPVPIA